MFERIEPSDNRFGAPITVAPKSFHARLDVAGVVAVDENHLVVRDRQRKTLRLQEMVGMIVDRAAQLRFSAVTPKVEHSDRWIGRDEIERGCCIHVC